MVPLPPIGIVFYSTFWTLVFSLLYVIGVAFVRTSKFIGSAFADKHPVAAIGFGAGFATFAFTCIAALT